MALLGGILLTSGCTFSLPQDDDEPDWELLWSDEFRGPEGSPPDPDNWSHEVGRGPDGDGWGNGEIQYYTDRVDNASLDGGGFLKITAVREPYEGQEWTSARIVSRDKFQFSYGRVEIRARSPVERGMWPALWMLGADLGEVGWPLAGEIDIAEVFGDERVGVAAHGPGYSGGNPISGTYEGELEGFAEEFHLFEVVWDPDHLAWAIDGQTVRTATPADLPAGSAWVYDHDFFFLMNVAVGGVVPPPDESTPDRSALIVDYVRVYQRARPLADPDAP